MSATSEFFSDFYDLCLHWVSSSPCFLGFFPALPIDWNTFIWLLHFLLNEIKTFCLSTSLFTRLFIGCFKAVHTLSGFFCFFYFCSILCERPVLLHDQCQKTSFLWQKLYFYQKYLCKGLETQTGEKLSIYLIMDITEWLRSNSNFTIYAIFFPPQK